MRGFLLPAGHVGRVVTLHVDVVEHGVVRARVLARVLAVEADVELLAVLGVGVQRVDDLHAVELEGVVLGAREPVGQRVWSKNERQIKTT